MCLKEQSGTAIIEISLSLKRFQELQSSNLPMQSQE